MHKVAALACLTLALSPLRGHAQGMKEKDPTKNVENGGIMVPGWQARVDFPERNEKVENSKFVKMDNGMHIYTGPHLILWDPANTAKGSYTVHATIAKVASTMHEESYGIFVGGTDLTGDNQNYLYCVVFGAGDYSVIQRTGATTQPLVKRQPNAAVHKADDKGGATDDLAITVSNDKVSCSINGTEVWSAPKSDVIGAGKLVSTDGIYGLRASHNLSLQVTNFGKK